MKTLTNQESDQRPSIYATPSHLVWGFTEVREWETAALTAAELVVIAIGRTSECSEDKADAGEQDSPPPQSICQVT